MKTSELFKVIRKARVFLDRHVNSNPPWVWIDSAGVITHLLHHSTTAADG